MIDEATKLLIDRVTAYMAGSGEIGDFVRSVPKINSEDMRPWVMSFTGAFGAALQTQPQNQKTLTDFYFAVTNILGSVQDPGTVPADISLLSFNIQEENKRRNMFSNNVNMAMFVGPSGPTDGLKYRVPYVIGDNVTLICTFTQAAGWAGANRIVEVDLVGIAIKKALLKL